MDKVHNKRKRASWFRGIGWIVSVVVLLLGAWSSADAAVLISEEDVNLRWDNTIRYNYGVRMRSPHGCFLTPGSLGPNFDDGDRNFSKGTITNRLDIISEMDLVFKRDYGIRVSATFWYDQRYHDPLDNDSVATSNHFENGRQAIGLTDQVKRLNAGPDGEVLDAFLFGRFDLGQIPVSIKVGRHTVYWGESLLFGGIFAGISYSQAPVDMGKAFSVPGSEAKELFRPLGHVSMQAQLTNTISLAGQYFFQWEPYRFPESGSFFNPADIFAVGGESYLIPTGVPGIPYYAVMKGDSAEPDGTKNYGVSIRWNPDWLGGSMGFYYRRFADMLPQLGLLADMINGPRYFFMYGDEIDLYGVSLSTKVMGLSLGSELSYRKNMPLYSGAAIVMPGVDLPQYGIHSTMPGKGETYGARGNTFHGLVNLMGLMAKTWLFDSAVWIVEGTWTHYSHVSDNLASFAGPGGLDPMNLFAPYSKIDKVTEHAFMVALNFNPTWYQVFPGMDLSMPISFSRGLHGNSANFGGAAENSGNWSVGLDLDVYQKYKFSLQYAGYYGDVETDASGGMSQYNGLATLLKDRDNLVFTFKTTF
jgi:hypothetical protein